MIKCVFVNNTISKLKSFSITYNFWDVIKEFEVWYNNWRPHMTLDGIRPDDVYYNNKPDRTGRDAKTVPCNI